MRRWIATALVGLGTQIEQAAQFGLSLATEVTGAVPLAAELAGLLSERDLVRHAGQSDGLVFGPGLLRQNDKRPQPGARDVMHALQVDDDGAVPRRDIEHLLLQRLGNRAVDPAHDLQRRRRSGPAFCDFHGIPKI